jgi:hypothetical protein
MAAAARELPCGTQSSDATVEKVLSDDHVQFYYQHGYLVLPNLFTNDEKMEIRDEVGTIETWADCPGQWLKYYEPCQKTGTKLLCRTENFIPYSSVLQRRLTRGKLTQILAELTGEPVILYKDKINYKYPGGGSFAPHQDSPAYTDQGQSQHITALIAIDAATVENGCLEVATNRPEVWQKRQTLPHTKKGSISPEIVAELEWKPLPLNRGDVVIFGSYIPHRSGPNLSTHPRRAIYITFNPLSQGDRHDQYYVDKRKKFPPEVEREPGKDYSDGAKIYNLGNPIYD